LIITKYGLEPRSGTNKDDKIVFVASTLNTTLRS
jgi:hypothetical protein